jgi:hypothetical protein
MHNRCKSVLRLWACQHPFAVDPRLCERVRCGLGVPSRPGRTLRISHEQPYAFASNVFQFDVQFRVRQKEGPYGKPAARVYRESAPRTFPQRGRLAEKEVPPARFPTPNSIAYIIKSPSDKWIRDISAGLRCMTEPSPTEGTAFLAMTGEGGQKAQSAIFRTGSESLSAGFMMELRLLRRGAS